MADVGYSFAPGTNGNQGSNAQRSAPNASTQDAIQMLRFRLPSLVGANSPAPPQFMQGPTAQGAQMGMGGSMAEQFLRALFGGMGAFNPGMNPMQGGGLGGGLGASFGGPSGAQSGGQDQSQGLPVSWQFGGGPEGPKAVDPGNIINQAMPPSPTNPATGNQFVNFGTQPQQNSGGMMGKRF
jgi:hypothetical protein